MSTTMYPFEPITESPATPPALTVGPPPSPAVGATVVDSPARQEALARLLGRAELYGDRGDSTKTITDLLNGVDMGRGARTAGMWDTRNSLAKTSGDTYVTDLAAALTALRKQNASSGGGGRRSGGGGGGGGGPTWPTLPQINSNGLAQFLNGMRAPAPAPRYTTPVPRTGLAGYGASQHPIANTTRRAPSPTYARRYI